jgi:hypothetical protein
MSFTPHEIAFHVASVHWAFHCRFTFACVLCLIGLPLDTQAVETRLAGERQSVGVDAFRKLAMWGKPAEEFRIKSDHIRLDLAQK